MHNGRAWTITACPLETAPAPPPTAASASIGLGGGAWSLELSEEAKRYPTVTATRQWCVPVSGPYRIVHFSLSPNPLSLSLSLSFSLFFTQRWIVDVLSLRVSSSVRWQNLAQDEWSTSGTEENIEPESTSRRNLLPSSSDSRVAVCVCVCVCSPICNTPWGPERSPPPAWRSLLTVRPTDVQSLLLTTTSSYTHTHTHTHTARKVRTTVTFHLSKAASDDFYYICFEKKLNESRSLWIFSRFTTCNPPSHGGQRTLWLYKPEHSAWQQPVGGVNAPPLVSLITPMTTTFQ